MAARRSPGSKFAARAWHGMGVRFLLCCHHRGAVALPFSAAHRLDTSDYFMPDRGRLAFREAHLSGLLNSVAAFRRWHPFLLDQNAACARAKPTLSLLIQKPKAFGRLVTSTTVSITGWLGRFVWNTQR